METNIFLQKMVYIMNMNSIQWFRYICCELKSPISASKYRVGTQPKNKERRRKKSGFVRRWCLVKKKDLSRDYYEVNVNEQYNSPFDLQEKKLKLVK